MRAPLEAIKQLAPWSLWELIEELEWVAERQHGWLVIVEPEYFWMPTHQVVQ